MNLKLIFSLALLPYALWLMIDYQYHFIDGANLLIHEAGHFLFNFFGNHFLMIAGGTIFQLAVPVMFAVHLYLDRDRYGSGLCIFWTGESLIYCAVYVGDALAHKLPLWGGGKHDWSYMLEKVGLLAWCREISMFVHIVGVIVLLAGLFIALRAAVLPEIREDAEKNVEENYDEY